MKPASLLAKLLDLFEQCWTHAALVLLLAAVLVSPLRARFWPPSPLKRLLALLPLFWVGLVRAFFTPLAYLAPYLRGSLLINPAAMADWLGCFRYPPFLLIHGGGWGPEYPSWGNLQTLIAPENHPQVGDWP